MNGLTTLIRSRIQAALGRRFQVAAIFAAAAVTALFGVASALMAARAWLTDWFQSSIKADATLAGALVILALIIAAVAESVRRAPPREIPTPLSLAVGIPVAARLAPRLLNPTLLGVASVIVGGILISKDLRRK